MKSLSDYVKEYDNSDLAISFKRDFYLYENLYKIDEKYGSYEGQLRFTDALSKAILKSIDFDEDTDQSFVIKKDELLEDMPNLQNVFFNNLHIKCSKQKSTAYIQDKTTKDKTNLQFNDVYININIISADNYQELYVSLTHELTHAWEDYQRFVKRCELSLSELVKVGSPYSKMRKHEYIDPDIDLCKELLYSLTSIEQNAFISELSNVLSKDDKINDYKNALKKFKSSDTWRRYEEIVNLLDYIKKNDDTKTLDSLTKAWNEVYNEDKLSSYVYKKVYNIAIKAYDKIKKLVPKIYFDFYNKQKMKSAKLSEGMVDPYGGRLKIFLKSKEVEIMNMDVPNWIKLN